MDQLKELEPIIELLSKLLKFTGTIGTLFGVIYFVSYIRTAGIPFPMELSVLPTILLLVGLTSIFITTILVGGILIPALFSENLIDLSYEFFHGKEMGRIVSLGLKLWRYLYLLWLPTATTLAGCVALLIGKGAAPRYVGIGLLFFSIIWIVGCALLIREFKEKFVRAIVTFSGLTVLSAYSYFLLLLLIVYTVPDFKKLPDWAVLLSVLIFFTIIHMLITVPNKFDAKSKIVLPPNYKHAPRSAPVLVLVIAVVMIIFSAFYAPISSKIGGVVLSFFNVGGGIDVSLCLKSKPSVTVSQKIWFGKDDCSEGAKLIFDASDKLYVLGESSNGEPISFRQDEVKNKIYLHPVKKPQPSDNNSKSIDKSPLEKK